MTTSKNVGDNLNDKNTKTPPSKDPNSKELMKRFKAARKAKKKGKKKSYSYMSALEPRKTARDILIKTGQIKEGKKYNYKSLKDNKMPLTPEERKEVMAKKAVWHFNGGVPSPAIWKAKDKDGKIVYGTNTHRAMQIRPTLKSAIAVFHSFIKGTA